MIGGDLQIKNQRITVGKWLVQEHTAGKWLNWNHCATTYLSNLKWNCIAMPRNVNHVAILMTPLTYTMACHCHAILLTLFLRWRKLHFNPLDVFLSVSKNPSCEKSFIQFLSNYPILFLAVILPTVVRARIGSTNCSGFICKIRCFGEHLRNRETSLKGILGAWAFQIGWVTDRGLASPPFTRHGLKQVISISLNLTYLTGEL